MELKHSAPMPRAGVSECGPDRSAEAATVRKSLRPARVQARPMLNE